LSELSLLIVIITPSALNAAGMLKDIGRHIIAKIIRSKARMTMSGISFLESV
jgi:hypothetical protein